MPEPAALELLLAHGGDPNEPAGEGPTKIWGAPLLRAIAVRRSSRHVAALLAAGADPLARTPGGISAYRLAMQVGLTDAAGLLRVAGAAEALAPDEAFVAACAGADAVGAQRIQAGHPDLPDSLPADRLRLMPDAAAWGSREAVKVMVERGWPIDVRGGDWDATALNHAVFRGDPELTGFLLAHGANWREGHGYGSDVFGTLSWASVNEPTGIDDPDWIGCARALMAHGLAKVERDPSNPERVLIDSRPFRFSDGVTEVLLEGESVSSEPSSGPPSG
jgi:ankyrin repeat protein